MKKGRVLIMAAALVCASVFSFGCGKEKVTAESLLQEVAENTKDFKSAEANMKMDYQMAVATQQEGVDVNIDMDMKLDMDMQMLMDAKAPEKSSMHMKGKLDMNMSGISVGLDIENYTVPEGDQIVSYTGTKDVWEKTVAPAERSGMVTQEMFGLNMNKLIQEKAKLELAPDTVKVGDKECYKLKVGIQGDALKDMMDMSTAMLAQQMGNMGTLDLSQASLDYVVYIDKNAKLPVKMEADATEMMKTMMNQIGEASGASVDFKKFALIVEMKNYNTVTEIVVPDDIKNKAVNAADSDDSFLEEGLDDIGEVEEPEPETFVDENGNPMIYDYEGNYAAVFEVPEDVELDYLTEGLLGIVAEDGALNFVYTFYNYTASEEMKDTLSMKDVIEEEPDGYKDYKDSEVKQVKVGSHDVNWFSESYIYQDMKMETMYAWVEVSEDVMLACQIARFDGESLTKDDIVSAFECVTVK